MSKHAQIGNRHLLPVQGCKETQGDDARRVRIMVSDSWAASTAGQLLVSCLVNLLVRQVGYVRRIEIICENTPCVIRLPGVASPESFPQGLIGLASWAVDGAVEVSLDPDVPPADQLIYIGSPPPGLAHDPGNTLCAIGDGWRAWVGSIGNTPAHVRPASANPIGPFLAACLLAGEVFKHSRGLVRGRYLTADGYSLWSGQSASDWHALQAGPSVAGTALPPVHIVGAGAVGNALAYVASYLQLSSGYFITIDDDYYDDTNLNRCPLAGWNDLGERKVYALARALKDAGNGAYPFVGSIKSYLSDPRSDLRRDITAAADELQFDVVVSCVDKGISRQNVQGLHPRLLLGSSTLNLQAKANHYGARPGSACLGCFNRAERDGERVRALEAQLRTLPSAERREFLRSNDLPGDAIEDYLSGAPCGSIGAAALKDFATRLPPQFSAGFVSLGAGLLLASVLLKRTAFADSATQGADMTTLNFLNGGLLDVAYAADPECELKCQAHAAAVA